MNAMLPMDKINESIFGNYDENIEASMFDSEDNVQNFTEVTFPFFSYFKRITTPAIQPPETSLFKES